MTPLRTLLLGPFISESLARERVCTLSSSHITCRTRVSTAISCIPRHQRRRPAHDQPTRDANDMRTRDRVLLRWDATL